MYIPVDQAVGAKDVVADIQRTRITLGIRGQEPVLEGELWKEIKAHESGWVLDEEEGQRCLIVTLIKRDVWIDYDYLLKAHETSKVSITGKCYLDVSIGGTPSGRIIIGVYGNAVPKTAANFQALCSGEKGLGRSGRPLCYKGCKFTRVLPTRLCQAGDIVAGDGSSGESIYGRTFADESLELRHTKPGIVSMANAGPNTNSSQFFITMEEAPDLDGKYVVFGEVLEGLHVVQGIGECGDPQYSGAVDREVVIEDCGVLVGPAGTRGDRL